MTADSGVDFVHSNGDSGEKPFPAANGSGAATFDFDLDGLVDLYFLTGTPLPVDRSRGGPVNRCYRNRGDWKFQDVTIPTGLADGGFNAGVAVGDVDGDGFADVFLNGLGPHRLYRNQGDGTFVEMGAAAGVNDEHWGTSAAFLDYDGDGWLDLYVCHYGLWTLETNEFCGDTVRNIRQFCNPTRVEPAPHLLYHNEGNGTFRNATLEARVGSARGRGQGVVAADINGDGRIDLYIANDMDANFLYLNVGDGTFRDVSLESGTASDYMGANRAGMGVDTADANHDGRMDLFVTNFEREGHSYFENLGNNFFQEVSRSRGLTADSISWVCWGAAFVDFDLDGWPDVVVTDGHVNDRSYDFGRDTLFEQPPGVWHNVRGRFVYAGGSAAGAFFERRHVGRGLAIADLDNDGDPDVVIVHLNSPPVLLRNDALPVSQSPWVRVQLTGTVSNRDAVGAELRLTTGEGDLIVQQIKGGSSYLSAHDLRQILAVPGNPEQAKLEIRWPSGRQEFVEPLEIGQFYRLIER